jgi:hypothetical protein
VKRLAGIRVRRYADGTTRRWLTTGCVFDAVGSRDAPHVLARVLRSGRNVRQLLAVPNGLGDAFGKLLLPSLQQRLGSVEGRTRTRYGVVHIPSVADQHVAIHGCHLDETPMLQHS